MGGRKRRWKALALIELEEGGGVDADDGLESSRVVGVESRVGGGDGRARGTKMDWT